MKIEISHFDNSDDLKKEIIHRYRIPEKAFSKTRQGKLTITLDEDEEYLIPDFSYFREEVEDMKFVHAAVIKGL